MPFDLTGQKLSETYQRLVQYDTGSLKFYTGIGGAVSVTGSIATASHAEMADTASFSQNAFDFSSSFESRVTIDESTIQSLQNVSGSYATTGSNIFLGNQTITGSIYLSGSLAFNTSTPNPTWQEGLIFYDSSSKALGVYNDEADITLQVGQEMWVRVYNPTAGTITNGSVVYISGSAINGLTDVDTAKSDNLYTTKNVLGFATHDIEAGTIGYVTTFGSVNDIDTSGLIEGASLYLSPTVAGGVTSSRPTPPYYAIQVGNVGTVGVTGSVLVNIRSIENLNIETIYVSEDGGDFTTLGAAMDSITDNSETKRYLINIQPGDYYETNPIQGKFHVSINAIGRHEVTRLLCNNPDQHGFIAGSDTEIVGIQVKGCSGSNAAGFYISGSTRDVHIQDSKIRDCGIGYLSTSTGSGIRLGSSILSDGTVGIGIKVTSGSSVYVNNFSTNDNVVCNTWVHCDGSGSKVTLMSAALQGRNTTNGIDVQNGGKVEVAGLQLNKTDVAITVGSASQVNGVAVDIEDSTTWDILTQVATATVRLSGLNAKTDKFSFFPGSDILIEQTDDKAGDKGVRVIGELSVGLPEFPSEAVFGEGDSYTRGMKVYTFMTGTLAYTDVTVSASTVNDGLTMGFPSQSINNMIYVASTLQYDGSYVKHYGVKVSIPSVSMRTGSSGRLASEYWNGTSWKPMAVMVTRGSGDYQPFAQQLYNITGSYQVRYDWRVNNDWTPNDPVGYGADLYWTRYRVTAPISRSFQLDQIKLHSNRYEINADGFPEYFGRGRPWGTLPWDVGLLKPGAASPADQDVYLSDTLDVGHTENLFANNATDRIGFVSYLPQDLDTSCPVQLQWSVIGSTTAPADVIGWVVRWGYSKDGDLVYPDAGTAPTYAVNGSQQSQSLNVLPPSTSNKQKSYRVDLDVKNMVSRRGSGSFGDTLWATLGRPSGDAYGGDVALINLTARYTKWCDGGHQF